VLVAHIQCRPSCLKCTSRSTYPTECFPEIPIRYAFIRCINWEMITRHNIYHVEFRCIDEKLFVFFGSDWRLTFENRWPIFDSVSAEEQIRSSCLRVNLYNPSELFFQCSDSIHGIAVANVAENDFQFNSFLLWIIIHRFLQAISNHRYPKILPVRRTEC